MKAVVGPVVVLAVVTVLARPCAGRPKECEAADTVVGAEQEIVAVLTKGPREESVSAQLFLQPDKGFKGLILNTKTSAGTNILWFPTFPYCFTFITDWWRLWVYCYYEESGDNHWCDMYAGDCYWKCSTPQYTGKLLSANVVAVGPSRWRGSLAPKSCTTRLNSANPPHQFETCTHPDLSYGAALGYPTIPAIAAIPIPASTSTASPTAIIRTSIPPMPTPHTFRPPFLTTRTATTPIPATGTISPIPNTYPPIHTLPTSRTTTPPYLTTRTATPPYLTTRTATPPYLTNRTATPPYLTTRTATPPYLTTRTATPPYLTTRTATPPYLTTRTATPPYLTTRTAIPEGNTTTTGTPTIIGFTSTERPTIIGQTSTERPTIIGQTSTERPTIIGDTSTEPPTIIGETVTENSTTPCPTISPQIVPVPIPMPIPIPMPMPMPVPMPVPMPFPMPLLNMYGSQSLPRGGFLNFIWPTLKGQLQGASN